MIKTDIINKIYSHNSLDAIKYIKHAYQTQGHGIINFLYFGNAMRRRICEETNDITATQYKKALYESTCILPDGIALQLFIFFINGHRVKNLNGTDFIVPLLKSFKKSAHISIIEAYDTKIKKDKSVLQNAIKNLKERYNISVAYYQQVPFANEGKDINRNEIEKKRQTIPWEKILIMCIGTPKQEIIVQQNHNMFKKNNVLVINAWWRIDFMSGFEKRAPRRIVKIRVGETIWRIIRNPKKNVKKFLYMFGIIRLIIPQKLKNLVLKNP